MIAPALLPELESPPVRVSERPTGGDARVSAEYDLHGIVGIRLLDATAADLAAVAAQLGPFEAPLSRSPDIVLRFVDHLSVAEPLSLIGVDDAAFDDDVFVILRGKHRSSVRVAIPFDTIGEQCEIECEHGAPAVPLLIAIINLSALGKGALPVHASAFRYAGKGVLVSGWSKGGKTETLLGFLANGAEYIGDEWIYLTDGGDRMCGIPEPIRVRDWHLDELPEYRRRLAPRQRLRLRALRYLANGIAVAAGGGGDAVMRKHLIRRLADLVERQRYVHLRPREAFGARFGALEAPLDKVVFVASHASSAITTRPVSGKEVAARMAFSAQEERSNFMSYYRKFRFAFPDKNSPLIDAADDIEREQLSDAFENRECHEVLHPYPVSIPALFDAVRPLIEA
jgi:hypothetical protein